MARWVCVLKRDTDQRLALELACTRVNRIMILVSVHGRISKKPVFEVDNM